MKMYCIPLKVYIEGEIDCQRSQEIRKSIQIFRQRYRGDRQKWSRIIGSHWFPRSFPSPHPISHGNYACHHERATVKREENTTPLDALNYKSASLISPEMQVPHCYISVFKMKMVPFCIPSIGRRDVKTGE